MWCVRTRTFVAVLLLGGISAASGEALAQSGGRDPWRTAPTYGSSGGYGTGSNPNSHTGGGYYNRGGSYVEPYRATNPNGTTLDNYGTRGNTNPYNGRSGTRDPWR